MIVCVSILAIAFAFSQERAVSFRRAFSVTLPEVDVGGDHTLPRPIVSDLNWDGLNEVVLLSGSDMIAVLPTHMFRRSYENQLIELAPKHIAPLTSACIGLGVGHEKGNASYLPNQVVAAISNDYIVTLFSSELSEIWSVRVPTVEAESFVPESASILILPQAVYEGDTGMVIVGVDTLPNNRTMGLAHYSYYAFNLKDGRLRWQHDADDYRDADTASQRRYPHQSFKLTTKDLETHSTEVDWRTFRRSLVQSLPHRHDHPWDTYLEPHAFTRPKNRKKREAHSRSQQSTQPKYQTRARDSTSEYGELGVRLSAAFVAHQEKLTRSPNVIVVHTSRGIEVLHLFTGRPLCQVGPLRPHVTYDDFNGDWLIDAATTSIKKEQEYHNGVVEEKAVCAGVVSSNVPFTQETLFRAPICRSGPGVQLEMMMAFLRGSEDDDAEDGLRLPGWGTADHFDIRTRATAPASIHRKVRSGFGIERMAHDVVFHLNSGLVTSVDTTTRTVRWRAQTEAVFPEAQEGEYESGSETPRVRHSAAPYPHTLAYNPAARGAEKASDPYVLAIGTDALALIHVGSGAIEETLELASSPTAPLVIGDFNSDGVSDLVVLTRKGYEGYLGVQRQGHGVLPYLLLSVVTLVGALVFTQRFPGYQDPWAWHYATGGKRSTD